MTEPKPYGSIVERFRGTAWETPRPEPPSQPPVRRGALIVLAVLVVVIGAGIAVVSQLGGRPSPSFPAVGGQPGMTPRVPDSLRVLENFWSFVRAKDLAYHLDGTGSSHADGFDESFVMSLDIVGDNYVGTIDTIGGSGLADFVRLDGVMFLRVGGADWVTRRYTSSDIQMTPFMGMEGKRELAYDHRIETGSTVQHLLVTTDTYAPNVNRMLDLSAFRLQPTSVSLELIVTDAGVPVSATFSCVVEPSVADGIPGFEGSASYAFSRFGEAVDIRAPVK